MSSCPYANALDPNLYAEGMPYEELKKFREAGPVLRIEDPISGVPYWLGPALPGPAGAAREHVVSWSGWRVRNAGCERAVRAQTRAPPRGTPRTWPKSRSPSSPYRRPPPWSRRRRLRVTWKRNA